MTIAVVSANRGTATEKVADNSLTLTPLANIAAGNYAILVVVIDNIATAVGDSTTISVTDNSGSGDAWIRDKEYTRTAGVANDGVTTAIFRCKRTAALTTSHTVSIALTASTPLAKGAGLCEVSVGAGNTLEVTGTPGAQAGAASTSYTVTVGSLASAEHLYVGISAAEGELNATVANDTAFTTQLFGGDITSGEGGATTSNVLADCAALIETSTTQTFDNSGLTAADRVALLVAYVETTPAATSLIYPPNPMQHLLVR